MKLIIAACVCLKQNVLSSVNYCKPETGLSIAYEVYECVLKASTPSKLTTSFNDSAVFGKGK